MLYNITSPKQMGNIFIVCITKGTFLVDNKQNKYRSRIRTQPSGIDLTLTCNQVMKTPAASPLQQQVTAPQHLVGWLVGWLDLLIAELSPKR